LYSFLFKQNTNDTNFSELEIARSGMWKLRKSPSQPPLSFRSVCEPRNASCLRASATETRSGNANRTVLFGGSGASSRTASRNAHSSLENWLLACSTPKQQHNSWCVSPPVK